MKIITVCGSLKFYKEMMNITEKMELQGNCVLVPIYILTSLIKMLIQKKKNLF